MIPRVWAPRARRLSLVVGDRHVPCAPAEDGWFESPEDVAPGTDYAWSIDGGAPRADPRSHHQARGLRGPSRVVDHDAFVWTDRAWRGAPLGGAVISEVHVGTFTPEGTFAAAAERLGHLADLGVTHVELLPVHAFPGGYGWGYDGVLWYAVHHPYGGPDGLKRFVDAAHGHGLAVLLDVVYNHVGPEGNHLDDFGPYFTTSYHTPWGPSLNLDGPDSPAVRSFVTGTLHHWFSRYHVDGLRLDATHELHDSSARHVLEDLAAETSSIAAHLGKTLVLVAEDDRRDVRVVTPQEAGGSGLDGMWADDLHHAIHTLLTGESQSFYADYGRPEHLVTALRDAQVLAGVTSVNRRAVVGRPATGVPRHRFVVCSQNHDQVGNRARGDRLVHQVGFTKARLAAALVLLSPYTPLLFMGEEWGASSPFPFFADFEDRRLQDAVRNGRRDEFRDWGWEPDEFVDPIDPATARSAVLRWDEVGTGEHGAMLSWYRSLIGLRRSRAELTDPRPEHTNAWLEGPVLRLQRGDVQVSAVLSDDGTQVDAPAGHELLLGSDGVTLAGGRLSLPGWAVAVTAPR